MQATKENSVSWRSLLCILIWAVEILLLMYPRICEGFAICSPTVVPLVIVLGTIGTVLALSDATLVRKKAKEFLMRTKK